MNKLFDEEGIIKEGYAKFANREIALNADVPMLKGLETYGSLPILKSVFMFPTTKPMLCLVSNRLTLRVLLDCGMTCQWKTFKAKSLVKTAAARGGSLNCMV